MRWLMVCCLYVLKLQDADAQIATEIPGTASVLEVKQLREVRTHFSCCLSASKTITHIPSLLRLDATSIASPNSCFVSSSFSRRRCPDSCVISSSFLCMFGDSRRCAYVGLGQLPGQRFVLCVVLLDSSSVW
jgi:hypothetical protein